MKTKWVNKLDQVPRRDKCWSKEKVSWEIVAICSLCAESEEIQQIYENNPILDWYDHQDTHETLGRVMNTYNSSTWKVVDGEYRESIASQAILFGKFHVSKWPHIKRQTR